MAKRIKIKGKAPRGLSKATRQIDAAQEALDRSGVHMSVRSPKRSDAELAKIAGLGRGITKPSSTRKKLVKEGNRKFIGPRQLRSEIGEDVKAREKDLDYIRGKSPMDVVDYMLGNMHYREPKKLRAPERRRLSLENYDITYSGDEHSYGLGGIAKNPRLKKLLMRLMDRHLGGGQEFDA